MGETGVEVSGRGAEVGVKVRRRVGEGAGVNEGARVKQAAVARHRARNARKIRFII